MTLTEERRATLMVTIWAIIVFTIVAVVIWYGIDKTITTHKATTITNQWSADTNWSGGW